MDIPTLKRILDCPDKAICGDLSGWTVSCQLVDDFIKDWPDTFTILDFALDYDSGTLTLIIKLNDDE